MHVGSTSRYTVGASPPYFVRGTARRAAIPCTFCIGIPISVGAVYRGQDNLAYRYRCSIGAPTGMRLLYLHMGAGVQIDAEKANKAKLLLIHVASLNHHVASLPECSTCRCTWNRLIRLELPSRWAISIARQSVGPQLLCWIRATQPAQPERGSRMVQRPPARVPEARCSRSLTDLA